MQKKTIITIGLLFLILLLLCFPTICLQAAQDGLLLWFNKVLPSLLPFMIIINILVPLDGLRHFIIWCAPLSKKLWHLPGESFFAFLLGLIAGYPMGAKIVKSLYESHQLSKKDAERTLCFCNNCGPLFIIGTMGTAMLSQTHLGYFLYLIHLLSAFIMSLLVTRNLSTTYTSSRIQQSAPTPKFSSLLNSAVMNATDTIVCVGGYIILFSVLLAVIVRTPLMQSFLTAIFPNHADRMLITGILSSILEISNGANALSQLPISCYSLALMSAVAGFGGICVYFQALFVLGNIPIDTKPFFISKCLQGFISFALTLLLYPIYIRLTQSSAAFHSLNYSPLYILSALLILIMSVIITHFLFPQTISSQTQHS